MDYLITLVNVIAIFFLVAMNGFFVASEFSIVKVRPSRIDTLIKEGNSRAKYAKQVTEHLDAYLSVTQLGITIASLFLGWIGEPTVAELLQPVFALVNLPAQVAHTIAFVVGFSIITALHIVMGELVPKSLSIQKTEQIVLFVARPLIFCDKIMYPAVWVLNHVANWVLARFGVEAASETEEAHNEEELRLLMEESHKQGYIEKTELTYIDNVFDFSDRVASDVMVPRTDMICLYLEDSFDENIATALDERVTRYPICEEDKDHVIGYLHIKDLLRALKERKKPDLRSLARDILSVPESMPISKLLKMLQKNRTQIAVVIDEYGGTAGIVTIEDILEEIVGDIQDEFDEERPEIEEMGDKTYSVDGKVILDDINDMFELHLDTEMVDTIGGWMFAHLSEKSEELEVGQSVETPEAVFTVEAVDDNRINRVEIKLLHVPETLHDEIKEEYHEGEE